MARKLLLMLAAASILTAVACPAASAAQDERLTVAIETLEGNVEVRRAQEDEWQDASVGMTLAEGATISTGPLSTAGLAFSDNSIVIVKSLSEIIVDRFVKTSEAVETRLRVKMGTVRCKVFHGELRSDFKVTTPNMTASVRGTDIVEFSTSPDMGDYFRLGEEGLVLLANALGTRWVELKTASNSELIRLIEQAKIERTFRYGPFGLTDDEFQAAFGNPDQLDISPSEWGRGVGNPFFDRIGDQQSMPTELIPDPPESTRRRDDGQYYDGKDPGWDDGDRYYDIPFNPRYRVDQSR